AGVAERLPRSFRTGADATAERRRSRRQDAPDESKPARGRRVKSRDPTPREGSLAGRRRGSSERQKRARQNRGEEGDTEEQKIRAESPSGTQDRDAERRRAEINWFPNSQPPDARLESSDKGCQRGSILNRTQRDDETVGRACDVSFHCLVSSATRS